MISHRSSVFVFVIFGLVLTTADRAGAEIITYTASFTGTAELRNYPYSDLYINSTQITFSGYADTANVQFGAGFESVVLVSPQVTVVGMGTLISSGPVQLVLDQNIPGQYVAFGDGLEMQSQFFHTYSLVDAAGPLSTFGGNSGGQFATTSGLFLSSVDTPVIFTASVVPEPSSFVLLTLGFGVVLSMTRATRRRRPGRCLNETSSAG